MGLWDESYFGHFNISSSLYCCLRFSSYSKDSFKNSVRLRSVRKKLVCVCYVSSQSLERLEETECGHLLKLHYAEVVFTVFEYCRVCNFV